MNWWHAGKKYNTETMSNLDLIVEIDTTTRMKLFDDERFFETLRACVKELRHRLYQRRGKE